MKMADGAKLRVVRCPKCEKLLPELPDYPLYRCGGCNATLQAMNEVSARIDSSSGQVRNEICEGLEGLSEGKQVFPSGSSDSYTQGCRAESRGKEGASVDIIACSTVNSSPLVEDETTSRCRLGHLAKAPAVGSVSLDKLIPDSTELSKPSKDHDRGMENPVESGSRHSAFHEMPDTMRHKRHGILPFGYQGDIASGHQFLPGPPVGSSDLQSDSVCRCDDPVKNHNKCGLDPVGLHGHDKAELLRKLDELRDQLNRFCDISQTPRELFQTRRRQTSPNSWDWNDNIGFQGSSTDSARVNSPPFPLDNFANALSDSETLRPMAWYERNVQQCCPSDHSSSAFLGFPKPSAQCQMNSTAKQVRRFPLQTSRDFLHGQCMYVNSDPVLQPQKAFYDYPACFCMNSHKHLQALSEIPRPNICDSNLPPPRNHLFHQRQHPLSLVDYERKGGNASSWPQESTPYFWNPMDLEPEIGASGGFKRLHPRKPLIIRRPLILKENARICHPVTGGAPFIACYKCCKLLQLSIKFPLTHNKPKKLRCGACSEVISFAVDGKRMVFTFPAAVKSTAGGISDDSVNMMKKNALDFHLEGELLESSDYECECSIDGRPILASPNADDRAIRKEQISSSSRCEKLILSSSSLSSEENADSLIAQRDGSHSKANLSSLLPDSSLSDDVKASSPDAVSTKLGKGNSSKRTEQEQVVSANGDLKPFRQNSTKGDPGAREMDYSVTVCLSSGLSLESRDHTKEANHQKFVKGSDSFFAGLIKKSFKDLNRSSQPFENGKTNVSINGHPIPERLIRKAEKQAGPISPGQYWYDYRAGFWGVMGQECLGIIPPFIEEFNYPLPKNCSGGNTGVFVNGRELHQKDLDLLAGRGLPMTKDKSYVIEISGRVLDATSKEELDCLGKLAPTVEKVKHGFGMWVPGVM